MGSHPINLIFRFILELCALISIGIWGSKQVDGSFKLALSIGIPIIIAFIWGIFAVPNDPSRSGKAPVAVSGIVRLLIEFAIFAFAVWSLYSIGFISLSGILGIALLVHYSLSYDRIIWLLNQ